jgi:hypothetical protein
MHKEETSEMLHLERNSAETGTLSKVDSKHLETFEMWCWRRTGTISWTDYVSNEGVLHGVKEKGVSYI